MKVRVRVLLLEERNCRERKRERIEILLFSLFFLHSLCCFVLSLGRGITVSLVYKGSINCLRHAPQKRDGLSPKILDFHVSQTLVN